MSIEQDDFNNDCRKNKYEAWLEVQGYSREAIEKLLEIDPTGLCDLEYEDFRDN